MKKTLDLTNKRFGFWVALYKVEKSKSGQTQWMCLCECGTKKIVTANSLRSGNSTSCGCNHNPNLLGQKFGTLTVTSLVKNKDKSRRYWQCCCDCGQIIIASTYQLKNNIVNLCKCSTYAVPKNSQENLLNNYKKEISKYYTILNNLKENISAFQESTSYIINLINNMKKLEPQN